MRTRWVAGAAMAVIALVFGAPLAASAAEPVSFGAGQIVDTVDALGNRTGEVEKAIDTLYEKERIQLYVAYVDTFTNPSDAVAWTEDTANANGMGSNDYLLGVAIDGRTYYLSAAPDSPLSDEQLSEIDQNYIEPALRDGDWAGAAIGAATGLERAAGGGSLDGSTSGGGSGFVWFVLIAIVVVGVVLFVVLRRRTKSPAAGGQPSEGIGALSTAELKQRAGSALVRTDDAVKTSEEELGFAIASYGSEATSGFQQALADAKAQLSNGFTLQQKLDDSEPDTEEQQRSWYAQIIELCEKANAVLDEQAEAFDALRALEKNAPQAVATTRQAAATQQARLDGVRAVLATLSAHYTDAALATIADNPQQAEDRLGFAAQALTEAEASLTAGNTSEAAVAIRAGEEAVDQAKLLLDAIDRLDHDLTEARASFSAAISDLQRDVAEAKALPAGADSSGRLAAVVASTEQVLADVTAKLTADRVNPVEVVQRLEEANTQIDSVLGSVRDARAAEQRASAALSQTLLAARSQVSAAEDFITARRGAVGAEARTRLAEAGRLIVQAESIAGADPVQALTQAQRANQLGAEAIRLAQNDVGAFGGSAGGAGDLGGLFGGGSGGGSGGNVMGAVLGGILINSVLGGGGSSRGSGGGSIFSGGGGGGGRRSPGSFGGSGTRSRRGSGGRF
ncbi:putative membrane protein YgcG [Microterricola gilva]|uniref:Putative membrane protein YgcG n=1 Tax=Microterricola gilva TaxID=393267 RepID=A0A4Q8AK92_9MICO|nr:TPM domain-containing protein [Microterricola gilva]RZU64451.1 putative membrane protein YgcG [Microterricola gilva]